MDLLPASWLGHLVPFLHHRGCQRCRHGIRPSPQPVVCDRAEHHHHARPWGRAFSHHHCAFAQCEGNESPLEAIFPQRWRCDTTLTFHLLTACCVVACIQGLVVDALAPACPDGQGPSSPCGRGRVPGLQWTLFLLVCWLVWTVRARCVVVLCCCIASGLLWCSRCASMALPGCVLGGGFPHQEVPSAQQA